MKLANGKQFLLTAAPLVVYVPSHIPLQAKIVLEN